MALLLLLIRACTIYVVSSATLLLQVCQATLQLIDALLQCPLSAVFLRELVFGGAHHHVMTHSASSPPTPLTHTVSTTPVTENGNNLATERKRLEDTVSRFVGD